MTDKRNTQERQAVRRSWPLKLLCTGSYLLGGFFTAVMIMSKNAFGAGLAGLAACLFIICGRIAGGERVE